jgi:hypothetical protein
MIITRLQISGCPMSLTLTPGALSHPEGDIHAMFTWLAPEQLVHAHGSLPLINRFKEPPARPRRRVIRPETWNKRSKQPPWRA